MLVAAAEPSGGHLAGAGQASFAAQSTQAAGAAGAGAGAAEGLPPALALARDFDFML